MAIIRCASSRVNGHYRLRPDSVNNFNRSASNPGNDVSMQAVSSISVGASATKSGDGQRHRHTVISVTGARSTAKCAAGRPLNHEAVRSFLNGNTEFFEFCGHRGNTVALFDAQFFWLR